MAKLLTIDVGTTNWKVIIFNENGDILSSSKTPTVISKDIYNYDCYSSTQMWNSICACIKDAVKNNHSDINAISVTSMGEAVIPLDKDGNELSDIIPWFDTRSHAQSRIIENKLGADKVFDITGLESGAIFSLPKIMWVRDNFPEIFSKAAKWLQVSDYINYKLTGKMFTDYSLASRTLALDINANQWSEDMLRTAGITSDRLPTIIKTGALIGELTKVASSACGLKQGIPIVMGGHDHPMASVAGNVYNGKRILNSCGTAEPYLYVSSENASIPKANLGQRVGRHPDPKRYILWGGIVSSGICIEWAAKRLGMCSDWDYKVPDLDYDYLFSRCTDIPCGSGGILFTPYLRGSGAPHWNPLMKANFIGMNDSTTSRHMMRAVLEGLSYQGNIIINMQEQLSGETVSDICSVGGGSRGSLWMQIKADVTGKTIVTRQIDEATGQGAAIAAGTGIGLFKSLQNGSEKFEKLARTYVPNQENHNTYVKLMPVFEKIHDAVKESNISLHEFSLKN